MEITYSYHSSKRFLGRFGGGWQWKLGFQASERLTTIIISLLIVEVIIKKG